MHCGAISANVQGVYGVLYGTCKPQRDRERERERESVRDGEGVGATTILYHQATRFMSVLASSQRSD